MGITAISGPQISYGLTLSSSGAVGEYNEQRGPSMCDLGEALIDPRPQFSYRPGAGINSPNSSTPSAPVYGWAGLFGGPVVDQVPTTISTNAVALSFSATGTAPFTVSPTLSTAGGQLTKITNYFGSTLTTAVTVFAIDSAMAGAAFGSAGTVNIWDPTKAVSRCLTINGTSGSSNTNYVFSGFDLYGFQMTATIQGTSAGAGNTVTTAKAFKYLQTVTANTTTTGGSSNVTVGTADVYGFPLRLDHPAYVTVWWGPSTAATLVSISSGLHTFGAMVTPTSTTGDVRGTFASTTASSTANGFKLVVIESPSVANLATVGTSNVWTSSAGVVASSAAGGVNGGLNFAGLVGLPQA
jgi:hypothetical protein